MSAWVWLAAALCAAQENQEPEREPGIWRLPVEEPEAPLRPGPLGVRGHSLFQVATIDFVPDAPLHIPAGRIEIHTSMTWLNVFNYVENRYLIDGEFVRASATVWYGITDSWQVGIVLPVEYIGGGIMDTFIEGFHDAFGLDQGGRDGFDEGRFRIGISDGGGSMTWRSSSSGAYLGDITLVSRYRVLDPSDTDPGLSMGFRLKLPTATNSDFYESHGIGVGLDVNVFYPYGDWFFFGGLSAAMVGDTEVLGEELEKLQYSLLLAVERKLSDDLSVVAQFLAQSAIAQDFFEFSEWSAEISVGFKIRIQDGLTMQIAAIENLFNFDNSPDVGFHMGFIVRP